MIKFSTCGTMNSKGTYAVLFLVKHERGNGSTSIGAVTSLATDTNDSAAPAVLILDSGNGTSRHQHDEVDSSKVGMEITEVVDGE